MYVFLIVMHVIACLVLIAVILLQAGKGGGLSEEFGGGGGFQSIFGTKASTFLTKATAACAVIFLATSLTLALVSAKKQGSLLEKEVAKEEKAQSIVAPAVQKEAPAKAATTAGESQPPAKDNLKPQSGAQQAPK